MSEKKQQSLEKACKNAGEGIKATATERNMRIHIVMAIIALAAGLLLRVDWIGIAVIEACIALVMGLECVNTAIEAVVDLASPEYHDLAKTAKDAAAGAVLIAAIGSVLVGLMLYIPAILALIE